MTKAKISLLSLFALVAISIVLRPPVAAIGPLLNEISLSLDLVAAQSSALNAAPVLCFGLGAFLSPWLARKVGLNVAMMISLAVLFMALVLRLSFGFIGLMVGTLAAGLSIAVANVLLPTVVRSDFPNRVPLLTGVYTTLLALSASFAAWAAVASSSAFGGWVFALGIWALPSLLAVLLWIPKLRNREVITEEKPQTASAERRAIMRSPLAWAIVGFFGFQSLGFYAVLGWMPAILLDAGFSAEQSSNYLGFTTAIGIPFGLVLSFILSRFKSLAWLAAGASLVSTSGFVLLFIATTTTPSLLVLACILLGVGQSSTFPMSLSLIGTKAKTQALTTQLSAMSQGWGYLISAAGTFALGYLAAITHGWQVSIVVLISISAVQVLVGFASGGRGRIS